MKIAASTPATATTNTTVITSHQRRFGGRWPPLAVGPTDINPV